MDINLFTNYFSHPNPERKKEIDQAFVLNRKNKKFKRVVNLDTGEGRPSYQDFFNLMREYPDDVNILANADIYFDETLETVRKIGRWDAYCLTRWELIGDRVISFMERNRVRERFSQDAWIFLGFPSLSVRADFGLGIPGCDNRIAWILKNSGYRVMNPCYSIRAIHIHENSWRDPIRDYSRLEPPYYFPDPIHL